MIVHLTVIIRLYEPSESFCTCTRPCRLLGYAVRNRLNYLELLLFFCCIFRCWTILPLQLNAIFNHGGSIVGVAISYDAILMR